jgi:Multicopper oxidase
MSNRRTVFKGWLKRFRWLPLVAAGALVSLLLPIPGAAQNRVVPEGIGTRSGGACATGTTTAVVLLAAAAAPTVAPLGTAGTTTWSYEIVASNANGDAIPSPAGTTALGNATLSATNYNHITWAPVVNATSYKVLRTAAGGSPVTVGVLGSLVATAFDDQGAVATAYVANTANPVAFPATSSFVLTATTGYITTPDGNSIFMWGYANGNGAFQYPGPILCVNEADNVTITLKNSLPVASSLVFPGLTKVKVDGQLMSLNVGAPDNSFAKPAASGSAVTYTFPAGNPGTYLYESGSNPELQTRMGLVGALVVRPIQLPSQFNAWVQGTSPNNPCASDPTLSDTLPNGAGAQIKSRVLSGELGVGFVYNNCSSAFNTATEYMHLLTEIDPHMHHAIELATCQSLLQASTSGGTVATDATGLMTWTPAGATAPSMTCTPAADPTYDMTTYLPRYFMINGRSFPDTITPNNSSSIPSQPYGALVHVMPHSLDVAATHSVAHPDDFNPLPATVRFLNGGPVNYPFHPHSNHDQSIGVDGRMLINDLGTTPVSTSIDRFGYVVAPGQTSEALFSWTDAQKWDPATNPVGVPIPGAQNRADGAYWSGSPYLGVKLPLLNGITQWNQCGEYYHFAHSHDLVHVTNYGSPGGGMLTLIRVDPPPSLQTRYQTSCDGGPGWN